MKPKQAYHRNLGVVTITDQCRQMGGKSHDPTTCFVEHDGEIIEVTASLVTTRAYTVLFQRQFVPLIKTHKKTHTIRPPRKRQQIQPGDGLRMRHWEASPYRSPQVEFMTAICTRVEPVTIYEDGPFFLYRGTIKERSPKGAATLDRFARRDGFTDWSAMLEWFRINHGLSATNPFRGILIHWAD